MERDVLPNVNAWDEEGIRDHYKDAAEIGLMGVGNPVDTGLGNHARDLSPLLMVCEELCRAGSGGLLAAHGTQYCASTDHGFGR